MPFRFPLAALLKYRESIEEREDLLLRNAQQQVSGIRNQILQIQEQQRVLMEEYSKTLRSGVVASELHSFIGHKQQLELALDQLNRMLKEAENRRNQQRKVYEIARQKREVLSTVRDRQMQRYQIEEGRREQRQLDDLFLSRRKQDE